jgi:hypothetical protein
VANAPIANTPGTRVNPPSQNLTQPKDSAPPVVNRATQPATPAKPPTSGGTNVGPTIVSTLPDGSRIETNRSGATYNGTKLEDGKEYRILDGKIVVTGQPFTDRQMGLVNLALSPLVLSQNPNPYPQSMIDQYNKQYSEWKSRTTLANENRDRNLSPADKARLRQIGADTPAMSLPPNNAGASSPTTPVVQTGAAPQQMAPKDQ